MKKFKNSKKSSPLLGRLLQKIAPRIGATVMMEPEWHIAGQITFKNGKRSYFRYSTLDVNPVGASDISKDKDYANFFMSRMGYPVVPKSKTFYTDEWARAIGSKGRTIDFAYAYAEKIGLPVIVKPNSGSQGLGVALVHTKSDFYRAMKYIFTQDRIALVQSPIKGRDYRLVVLDDTLISAYERIPLNVIGNGTSTILELLKRKQKTFVATSRDTRLKLDDPRFTHKLKRQGLTLTSAPPKNQRVYLLDNANLSTGGDSYDITESIHPEFKKLAIQLTKDMGLRLCGVDLMVDGDISKKPIAGTFHILEVNHSPGLDHYAQIGKAQEKIVENLYLKVLEHLEKGK